MKIWYKNIAESFLHLKRQILPLQIEEVCGDNNHFFISLFNPEKALRAGGEIGIRARFRT